MKRKFTAVAATRVAGSSAPRRRASTCSAPSSTAGAGPGETAGAAASAASPAATVGAGACVAAGACSGAGGSRTSAAAGAGEPASSRACRSRQAILSAGVALVAQPAMRRSASSSAATGPQASRARSASSRRLLAGERLEVGGAVAELVTKLPVRRVDRLAVHVTRPENEPADRLPHAGLHRGEPGRVGIDDPDVGGAATVVDGEACDDIALLVVGGIGFLVAATVTEVRDRIEIGAEQRDDPLEAAPPVLEPLLVG